jgi:hypothetical protein|tara:strand:- start:6367 stop:6558 length:192 start_codon:yes stop_codon:yes gene_type:complete
MQEHSARGGDELNATLPTLNYGWLAFTKGVIDSGTYFSTLTSALGIEEPLIFWVLVLSIWIGN